MSEFKPSTASEWVALISAGPLSSDDEAALRRWLASSPTHQADFALAQMAWSVACHLDKSEDAQRELKELNQLENSRISLPSLGFTWDRRLVAGLTAAALIFVIAGAWLFLSTPKLAHPRLANGQVAATAINEISSFILPDGSTLTVNADSTVRVAFTSKLRQIVLERGEAFFEVQHNARKPFTVAAGARTVVVTGTKFDVQYASDTSEVQVAVVAGNVNVGASNQNAAATPVIPLSAGDTILFPKNGQPVRLTMSPDLISAWQVRRLYFDNATVRSVVAEVNRYAQKPVVVADEQVGGLPISGVFTAGDTDSILFSLKELHGIEAIDNGNSWLLQKTQ